MRDWSDRKNWYMDLVKTTLGSFLGLVLTLFVVAHFEGQRRQAEFAWEANQGLRVSAIQEFFKAEVLYRFRAFDAARERLRGVSADKSDAIRKYQAEAYPNLELATLSVGKLFPEIDGTLLRAFGERERKVFIAANAAPLFPLGKTPAQCDNEEEVYRAWKGQRQPGERTMFETKQMWEDFRRLCFERVLTNYDLSAEAIVARLRSRPAR